jgi:leucyl aminopeptidase
MSTPIRGIAPGPVADSKAIQLVQASQYPQWLAGQSEFTRTFLDSQAFNASRQAIMLLPDASGRWQSVLAILGEQDDPYAVAHLPKLLPKHAYHRCPDSPAILSADNFLLGWGLGAYRFEKYLAASESPLLHSSAHSRQAEAVLRESLHVRDLINTPTEHMGPDELEQAVREASHEFGGAFSCIRGDDLLTQNFPTIHAVGRASHRAPRLLRLDWGDAAHPHVAICGKGVCFDTGGLDIKPADGMRNMKKDMGGAAHALALARLVMDLRLPVRITLLIAAVENAIAGNAFRPGEVITTRQGLSVEIDNTDAEGRLVLSDALTLASELKPALILDYATLTGAARIALGPDLPVLFSNRDELAQAYLAAGEAQLDPLWRMPLWQPYLSYLKSHIADLANAGPSRMAGCVTAALFLQRFVAAEIAWAHVDVYSWNDSERPGRPAGGEAQGLRAALALLQTKYDNRHSASA